ncbi:2,3-bisphosphoglycerate-independent phosphoglycerate mutase [Dichanthelium oligosanthes]|uniref:phosphoglycerate mutase (2,3-diphosphoglycerate-independent) n=1 Tax=Dichanthelium oligosanthes TaxID=888268 RepID=A0A1E5V714_9POAL|nr:2,3-bisphosphoglycerate-independent phosphoglycerate mutase [Dichanthelium oligosanthes]
MLSQAVSLSSQPSLPSLPSLGPRDQNVSPSLNQCLATVRGHSSYVSALAVDGDSLMYSASSVKCLLAVGDGLLLSSHQDGKIRAWRAGRRKDGTRRLVLRAVLPTCVDRLRTFLLPWSYVQVRRHRWRTWVHHADAVTALAVSPDGALLYSASWDRSLKVWRLPGFRCVESVAPAHDDAINALAVSPDGHVYTGSADKTIKAWRRHPERKNKHVLVQTMERHRSAVNALALGADGKVLYSGACDRSIVVWERAGAGGDGRMEATGTLRGHKKAILCLAAAGDVVCSGSADRTVRVWRRGAENTGYTSLALLEGHGAPVKSLVLVYGRDRGSSTGGDSGGGSALVCSGALDGDGFNYIKESFENGTLHLIGLLSDGGVHSRLDQLQLLLKGASERGAKRICVHILTDGRDVLDGSSVGFVETLENDLSQLREKGIDARIASGGGRMYVTMDRYENDWDVVKRGWDAQVLGEAPYKFKSALEAVKTLRAEPKANDQYLPPFVIVDDSGNAVGPVLDGDAVVTINFRADRMVMLAKALEYADFDKFDRVRVPKIRYAGMLQYDGKYYLVANLFLDIKALLFVNFDFESLIFSESSLETVKFGHVTFFWNGNRSGYFDETKEEYVELPSDSGITFNVAPKMKALEIAEKARDAILSGKFDQVRVNLPNGDMVGHTGDIEATVVACKAADEAVKIILDAVEQVGGIYLVTADHGNAEDMVKRNKSGKPLLDKSGGIQILTSHTLQPVPVAIGGPGLHPGVKFRTDIQTPGLANVAATGARKNPNCQSGDTTSLKSDGVELVSCWLLPLPTTTVLCKLIGVFVLSHLAGWEMQSA